MNEKNTPITNAKCIYSVYGYITLPVGKSIFLKIAKLSYELYEDESYQYIFEPFYEVLEGLENRTDIPGINLELKHDKYYRVNLTPIFISNRTFPRSRVEARKLLKERNLNYYSPMLWLMDSDYTYTGDSLLLKSQNFFDQLTEIKESKNIYRHILYVLQNLGNRSNFKIGDILVNNLNRAIMIKMYMYQYKLVEHTYYQKLSKNVGRSKIEISIVLMKEVIFLYEKKIITLNEAMTRLGIKSESTFYRRLKEYRNLSKNIV